VYICTNGLLWRKCSLNDCTVLYFSQILETFCSYHVLYSRRDPQKTPFIFLLISTSPSQPLLQRTY
jgi:hypothetical protein